MTPRFGMEKKNTVKAVARPTTRDIAWAAGFIEGEGSFNRVRNSEVVSCSQIQEEPIRRLQKFFGGAVKQRKAVTGHGRTELFYWHVCGARARGFIMTIYTFLSPRRKQQALKALGTGPSA